MSNFCKPRDFGPPGSFVHGIFLASILEWVAMLSSRGFSWARDQTNISWIAGRFFSTEPQGKPLDLLPSIKLLSFFTWIVEMPQNFLLLFSHSVVSDYLWPHGLQHTRLPCPSSSPGACSKSCPLRSDAIQSSHPLSPSSLPALNRPQHQGLF